MKGAAGLLALLEQEGGTILFGNPGTTELPLMDALVGEDRVDYVLCLHEGIAIAMADGYAQASGGLAVVSVHCSPGLGNAMGMLYNAFKAGSPLLLIAGQHDQTFSATEPVVWSELPPVARPYVKWADEVRRVEDLPRMVHRAAKVALTPPTGPVFLSLPVDVQSAEADLDLGAPSRVDRGARPALAAIDAACDLLAKAERPLIVAGDSVAQSDALAELVDVAELLGASVYLEGMVNRCSFPFTHPLLAGSLPRLTDGLRALLDRHDLLFSVGGDLFTLSLPCPADPIPPALPIVHLDTDPWEIGKNYPARVALLGDPKATLPEISLGLRRRFGAEAHPDARARATAAQQARLDELAVLRRDAEAGSERRPIPPLTLMQAAADAMPADAVIVDESLSSGHGLIKFFRCADAQAFFGLRGGGVGWSMGAALGVKLALPHRPVVALVGDGSALYSSQSLWTAAHRNIPVTFVIINNQSYRMLKQRTAVLNGNSRRDGVYVGMDLEHPAVDFVGLARSLGVAGEQVERAVDLGPAVRRALESGAPYLLDVRTSADL